MTHLLLPFKIIASACLFVAIFCVSGYIGVMQAIEEAGS